MVISAQWSLTLYAMLSHFSHVQPFSPLWTIAHQAPLSMGFSRQEYQSGLSCPPPGDLPEPGIEPASLKSPALVGRFFTTSATWEAQTIWYFFFFFFSLENPLGRRFDFYLNKASTQCKYFISVGSVSCSVVSDSLGPMDCSLPGSVMELIHGILQVRILEGLAIPSSRGIFPM